MTPSPSAASRRLARLAAGLALVAAAVAPAGAQQPTPPTPPVTQPGQPPAQPPARPPRADTTRADSARARADTTPLPPGVARPDSAGAPRELVQFAEPDSIMRELMEREGYTPVRYQGDTVRFLAQERVLTLDGRPAAVQRDETLLVGRNIRYNDSTQLVLARPDSTVPGDSVVLRDPTQGSDLVVRGAITYDLAAQRGTIANFSTQTDAEGQTWVVQATRGAVATDTTVAGGRVFYAHHGAITSCTETVPHYHFAARDIKLVSKSLLVVRPAVLYIGDIPVMWLPFVFQDMRSGRRSGLLSPRFGVAELVRNASSYRRSVENIGYYFNLGNYADSQAWLDWRSGAGGDAVDPGWVRFNAETRYRWIDRFIQGRLSASYLAQRDGTRNTSISLGHEQSFNQNRRVSANINWVQSTVVRRQNQIDPNSVLGTINSQLNFQDKFGPASFSAGGSAKQYPGRDQRDLDFPNINLSAQTISLKEWLDWTPSVSFTNTQSFDIDQGTQFAWVYRRDAQGRLDSTRASPSRRSTSLTVGTPFKIFDFNLQAGFRFTEDVQDYPQTRVVYRDIRDTSTKETRVFNQTFLSSIDIVDPTIGLPRFFQGTWNVTPTIALSNVDAGGFFVRSERTGGRWVNQRKRLSYGLNASPTWYAFPGGFGPVERFRHSINPVLSYSYSPAASVSDEYLQAIGRTRVGYLGSLAQSRLTLQVSSNLEAKLRGRAAAAARGTSAPAPGPGGPPTDSVGTAPTPADTAAEGGAAGAPLGEGSKVRLLSLNFSALSYDFVRADSVGGSLINRSGFTDQTFGINARSDLVPGLDFRATYSLFLGDPASDTAEFKPVLTDVGVSFTLDQDSPLFRTVMRLFGRTPSQGTPQTSSEQSFTPGRGPVRGGDEFFSRQAMAQQVAGSGAAMARFDTPVPQGWQASVTYTSSRQRPDIRGATITLDPTATCQPLLQAGSQFAYEQCVLQQQTAPPAGTQQFGQTTVGAPIFRSPPTRNLQLNTGFHITPKWSAQWSTTYDFVRGDFGSNVVNLQRELHDWRAVFAVTQSPNGNFAFNFFVALKAQPDIKFDYNRQTYRGSGTQFP